MKMYSVAGKLLVVLFLALAVVGGTYLYMSRKTDEGNHTSDGDKVKKGTIKFLHYTTILDMDDEIMCKIHECAKMLISRMEEKFEDLESVKVVVNYGEERTNELIYSDKTIKMFRLYYYVDINSITDLKISEEVTHNIDKILTDYYERFNGCITIYAWSYIDNTKKTLHDDSRYGR